jgi:hypothetical protein
LLTSGGGEIDGVAVVFGGAEVATLAHRLWSFGDGWR